MQAVNKVSTVSVSPPVLDARSQAQSLGDDIAISVRNVGFLGSCRTARLGV
jgi:hypothetical protein